MTPDDVAWLSGPSGRTVLEVAAQISSLAPDALAAATQIRRRLPELDGHHASLALTQVRLRERARAKVSAADAACLLFSLDTLEQATRADVATYRATRVAAALPSTATVLDLCCGGGADLVALARTGLTVVGVDRDPTAVALSRHALAATGLQTYARVHQADVTLHDRSDADAVTCDPARRGPRGRTLDPRRWQPNWDFVREILRATACVKVAPGIAHDLVPPGVEAAWVSSDGDLVEAALFSGALASRTAAASVARRAVVLPGPGSDPTSAAHGHTLTDADDPGRDAVGVGPVGSFLYEPDPAVIRAGLVTAVAATLHGRLIDPHIAYVTADRLQATPFARAYTVLDTLPTDERTLRQWVAATHVGTLTIKTRGVDVDPAALRKRLRPRGDRVATLVLTRVAGRGRALVVQPVERPTAPRD